MGKADHFLPNCDISSDIQKVSSSISNVLGSQNIHGFGQENINQRYIFLFFQSEKFSKADRYFLETKQFVICQYILQE